MVGVCSQPATLGDLGPGYRWFLFMAGVVETMLWSGTIFGWASLVYVLKLRGVYSDLCHQPAPLNTTHDPNVSGVAGCVAQDERFTLVYTVTCVLYGTPGVLVGYCLHHLGLAATRVLAGLLVSTGFLLLSFTSAATPNYLWGATILLSIGGNAVRMCGLQLANLFPQRRNTAMAIISGIFTPSAGLFMVLQSLFESGVEWEAVCWGSCATASLTVLVTPLFPRHHVPYHDASEKTEKDEATEKRNEQPPGGPFGRSLISVSSFLHVFWLFVNLFGVVLFGTYFNSWISKFSKTEAEASFYSRLFGYANVLCAFFTPLPGLLVDGISSVLKRGKSGVMMQVAAVQAMIVPMVIVTTTVTIQLSTLLFHSSAAVYIGLVCLIINRPSCLSVGNPFVRARFPAEHFNRLIGIQATLVSAMTMLQYPHFTWAQSHYNLTLGVSVAVLLLGLLQPLHLLNKTYLSRVLAPAPTSQEANVLL